LGEVDIAIIGAGPHGLAAAAHLRRAGIDCVVFGDPMSFWRGMPAGMLLRSNWTATCIAEYEGPLSLDSFCAARNTTVSRPVPLTSFIEYGLWVQEQVAPDVDRRRVERVSRNHSGFVLRLSDEERIRVGRVVVAAGITGFENRPSVLEGLPPELATHTSEHADLGRFNGQQVLVVGGGQSALESAALMRESGADVEVAVRADHINWLHGGKYHRKLGRFAPLFYAPTDVGPLGMSRIVGAPGLFTRFPRKAQDAMAHRSIRPAGAEWLRARLVAIPLAMGTTVTAAVPDGSRLRVELSDGTTRVVDHLMFGTGYRVDIAKYAFLDADLVRGVRTDGGYPILRRGMESTVPGLHFLGAPAARSVGPIMRFVSGGWVGAQSLTSSIRRGRGRPSRGGARAAVSASSA
jgi:thioredoxin reductase